MDIAVDATDPAAVCVTISGTLDRDTAPRLVRAVLDAAMKGSGVVLDVSAFPLPPAGAALLLAAHMALAARGRELRLRGVPPGVVDMLQRTGLDEVLRLEPPP